MDYLKYWTPVLVVALTAAGLAAGGPWMWVGIASFPILAVLDTLAGRDYSMRKMDNATLANIPIWICCVGPVLLYFVFAWQIGQGPLTGWEILGGILSVGWLGVIPLVPAAHELYHMRSPIARTVGRYGHLCILDCTRDIGHVINHHIDVATTEDGDTAARGTNLYKFTANAVVESTVYAMKMESGALKKQGLHPGTTSTASGVPCWRWPSSTPSSSSSAGRWPTSPPWGVSSWRGCGWKASTTSSTTA